MEEIDTSTHDFLRHVVRSFTHDGNIHFACAYGSGVFKQAGHRSIKDNMIDFIFVVGNSEKWHSKNLEKFPHHYSVIRHLGPKEIAKFQRKYGARVYFNTQIDFDDRLIKYGVIDLTDFLADLHEWESLYIAGRLHKSVVPLEGNESADNLEDSNVKSDDCKTELYGKSDLDKQIIGAQNYLLVENVTHYEIQVALTENLRSAVSASLLMLPERFTERELYTTIAGLSYSGDLRMIIGEDKGKVENIVAPNMQRFRKLYHPFVAGISELHLTRDKIQQNIDMKAQKRLIDSLPLVLRNKIKTSMPAGNTQLTDRQNLQRIVRQSVSAIVKWSSTSQTLKGVLTAGVQKSTLYSAQKLVKMFRGMARK